MRKLGKRKVMKREPYRVFLSHATAATARKQVFISFSPPDREMAAQVARDLRSAGLKTVSMDQLDTHGEYTDSVRSALGESDAIVTVLRRVSNREQIPASVLFEIGAAVGAGKYIFVVVGEMSGRLPFNVPHLQVLPLNRIGEIATKLAA